MEGMLSTAIPKVLTHMRAGILDSIHAPSRVTAVISKEIKYGRRRKGESLPLN